MPDFPPIDELKLVRLADLKSGLIVYGMYGNDDDPEYDEDDNEIPREAEIYFQGQVTFISPRDNTLVIKRFDGPDRWNCEYKTDSQSFGSDCENGDLMMKRQADPSPSPKWEPLRPEFITQGATIATNPDKAFIKTGHIIEPISPIEFEGVLTRKLRFNEGLSRKYVYDIAIGKFVTPDGTAIFVNMNEVVKKRHFKCQTCGKMKATIKGSLCLSCNSIPF